MAGRTKTLGRLILARKALLRHAENAHFPEVRLLVGIIHQAIADCVYTSKCRTTKRQRIDALNFLTGKRGRALCESLGLQHAYVMHVMECCK